METKFEITLLAAYCSSFPPRSESEAREEYLRVFKFDHSFTFVQWEETALVAPMEWTETGTDESGTFNIFTPSTNNPYRLYKTSRIDYSGRVFEFHTFYHDIGAVFATMSLMRAMVAAEIVSDKQAIITLY